MKWLLLILIVVVIGIAWRLMRNRPTGSAFDSGAAPKNAADISPPSDSSTMSVEQANISVPEVQAVPGAAVVSAPPAQATSLPEYAEPRDPPPPANYDNDMDDVAPPAVESDRVGGTIKGDGESMKYHTRESPLYDSTVAEAWFESEEHAQAAGFTRWDDES